MTAHGRDVGQLERWAWASIGLNVGLIAAHALIAAVSGSRAVVAELVHNFVDLLSAIAVLIGLRLAARTSERFPYGLHKIENLVAAGLAGLVFLTAYELLRETLSGSATDVQRSAWPLFVVAASTAAPLVFSHFELRAATAANSPALIADAREYRVHAATTGLVFVSLAAAWFDVPADRVATVLIVAVVVKTGWDLLRDAMRVLLDASLDRATLDHIERVILDDPAVSEVTWLTGRSAGRFRFVEAGVVLRVTALDVAETSVSRVESSIRSSVPHVDRVLLHAEARRSPYVRCAIPLADVAGTLSSHFGQAPYFALLSVDRADKAVHERQVIANPHRDEAKARGILVAEWLVAHKVDVVYTREALRGKGPGHVLAEAGVELRDTIRTSVDDVVALDLV